MDFLWSGHKKSIEKSWNLVVHKGQEPCVNPCPSVCLMSFLFITLQIITEDDYNRYLQRGLNSAEAAAADAFHCKTPDCAGLCFYDDEINFFDCEVCKHQNCLTCKAIHEGQNCKQYQEDLRIKAANDEAAKKTHEALQVVA